MQSMPKWRKASHAAGPENNHFIGLNLLILKLYGLMLPGGRHQILYPAVDPISHLSRL